MSFDFFHTRPYGLLKIADANDLVTTLLLLVVGLVMGEVVERSARFKDRLRDDQSQLRRLHRVAESAASGDAGQPRPRAERGRRAASTPSASTTAASSSRPSSPSFPTWSPMARSAGSTSPPGTAASSCPGDGVDLRVVGPTGTIGRFVLVPTPDARRVEPSGCWSPSPSPTRSGWPWRPPAS